MTKEESPNVERKSGTWSKATPKRENSIRPRSRIFTDATLARMLLSANPEDHYAFLSKIGSGGFSSVFVAKSKKYKNLVAIKVLSQKFEKKNAKICSEISFLMTCNHPNIINHIESFLHNDKIYMVTEYCDVGSLDRILKLDIPESLIAYVVGQVLNGLAYLHSQKRVHKDIKCTNILLDSLGGVKIADLGLCEEVANGPVMGKLSGSKYWLAPEILARKPYDMGVDVWNVGILACTLATKKPPYGDCHAIKAMFLAGAQGVKVNQILLDQSRDGQQWSPMFADFLRSCFVLDPQKRPTSSELLKHPFLKKACPRSDVVATLKALTLEEEMIPRLYI